MTESEDRRVLRVAYVTLQEWLAEGVMHWGAAISFYTLISLGPLLIFITGVAGMLFDASTAQAEVIAQLRLVLGARGAEVAQTVLTEVSFPSLGSFASLGSLALLLFGATAVFGNIQGALNQIWHVTPVTGTIRNTIRTRLTAFLAILLLGALALAASLAGLAMSVVLPVIESQLPMGTGVVRGAEFLLSTCVLWLLFAIVYRLLPDAKVSWRDVWVGALVTAILFSVGTQLIGAILGRRDAGSAFGAAGSLFALLLWIYYSAQIFLIGASFTEVWARFHGRAIEPEPYAGYVTRTVEAASSSDA